MHAYFTPRYRVYPELFRTKRTRSILNAPLKKKIAAECCRLDTKEAMIFIKNKYELMIFTNIYIKLTNIFQTFPQKRLM